MFEVTLKKNAARFRVADNENILTAALREGIKLPHICRKGSCGACLCTVEKGDVKQDLFYPAALSQRDRTAGRVLLCCSRPLSDLVLDIDEVSANAINQSLVPARVVSIRRVIRDVAIVTLRLPPNVAFQYSPGQYLCIFGADGLPRPFSIANIPRADSTLDLHVGRAPSGKLTSHILDHMEVGERIRINGPSGSFSLSPDDKRPAIVIVGGTGYAPLRAILENLIAKKSARELHVYWGSRTPEGLYLRGDAEALVRCLPAATFTAVVSGEMSPDSVYERRGLVQEAALSNFADLTTYEVYACGSPGLVDAVRQACIARGLDPEFFHADSFDVINPNTIV